jgi:hypothetical protein
MNEIKGNLFSEIIMNFSDAICVTTNGVIKQNGKNVMGAGCALDAKNKFKGIDLKLGNLIKQNGNIVQIIMEYPKPIVAFPTKNNYWEKSDVNLIKQSLNQLITLTDKMKWKKVVLPRPGCNNGGLSWFGLIKPLLEQILNERFYVIDK